MGIPSVSPQEAQNLLDNKDGTLYLDVRSIPEFAEAHPASAVNVPLLHQDPSGRMIPNPDFLSVVQANFPPQTKMLVGCFSGGRSQKAVEILEAAGYSAVVNVRGGFGGLHDRAGRVVEPGWATSGLPVEQESVPGASYESLRRKVGH